jgi:thiamine-monophosphate kinase
VLGWVEAGASVLRSGARAGDELVVCGGIGDGWLGLQSVMGKLADLDGVLAMHYRLPEPLLDLRAPLKAHAKAAADVSDGLIADASHIAVASGLGLAIELADLPRSRSAAAWLADQGEQSDALLRLATGGDDYAIVCAIDPSEVETFVAEVTALGVPARAAGRFLDREDVSVTVRGRVVSPGRTGWRHSDDAGSG